MESISDGVRARIALEKHGFRFQHTLGQNFLLDDERIARIVALSGVNEADDVLEIGPGAGVLTCALARRARRVVALEIDRALAPVLAEMLSGVSNVRLEFADALKVDLAALMGGRFAVVANLPYYITADMVMKLLKSSLDISHITIMVQKEAAARMMARVGEAQYCLLAATIAYCAHCESLMDVPPGAFTPPPHVESRLLQITPYEKKPVQPRMRRCFCACWPPRSPCGARRWPTTFLARSRPRANKFSPGWKRRASIPWRAAKPWNWPRSPA